MKILIAEDNRFYRDFLKATLTEWGYEVIPCEDGLAAWSVLQEKEAPKLAILDWVMPGLEGPEICRKVRAMQREQPTYIILLTAKDGQENMVTGLKEGADDYIKKPFDREELQARLQVGLRIVRLQCSLADRVRELELALSGAQKMEAVGRLAGGIAHDFNNLLTIIIGNSELLGESIDPKDPKTQLIQQIHRAGERGAGLTRQLLAFSRKQVLELKVLDLNTLVADMDKMLRRLIGEDIDLVPIQAADLHRVKADPGQLEQVLMNLAVNARDAMPEGGKLTIETRNVDLEEGQFPGQPAVRPGPYAMVAVSDTGCGMDEHTKAHLFEPFFTTKEPGKGTGLGLATVYGIIKQSDGHITIESEPGRGATFRVYLPAVNVEAAARKSNVGHVPTRRGNETLLLVEDDDAVRALARQILEKSGYTVLEAGNGSDALQVCESNPKVDLMVTDVVMPQISGRQLADLLLPLRPRMKVIYMTGYTDDMIIHHRVLGAGTPFIQKPFTAATLTHKVREVLDQQRA